MPATATATKPEIEIKPTERELAMTQLRAERAKDSPMSKRRTVDMTKGDTQCPASVKMQASDVVKMCSMVEGHDGSVHVTFGGVAFTTVA